MWALKSGDLAVRGSDTFADYREQLISKTEGGAEILRCIECRHQTLMTVITIGQYDHVSH